MESEARELLADGHKVSVVSFLHSYLNDEHEKAVGEKLLEWGFERVMSFPAKSAGFANGYPGVNPRWWRLIYPMF